MNPDVTILMPLRGECAYLSDALNSILQQTYRGKVYLIIIDDGIFTNGLSTLNRFRDTIDLEIFRNSRNGLVSALNVGLERSKSELIARLDGDDLMDSRRIEKQVSFLLRNPTISVVGSQVTHIDATGKIIGKSNYPCGTRNLMRSLPYNCNIAHPSVMYRRSVIRNIGSYRNFYSHAEDYDLWLRLVRKSRLDNLPEYLTFYRIHGDQVSVKLRESQISASMAANESYRRRELGLRDLSDSYASPDSWRNDVKDTSFARRIHFFELKRMLWESRLSKESPTKQISTCIKLLYHPNLLIRSLVQRASLQIRMLLNR